MITENEIMKCAKDWISEQAKFADGVSYFEVVLSSIIGFDKTFKGYEGQEADYNKLVSKLQEYPKASIEFFGHVLSDYRPWNIEKVLENNFR